ncbi:MAG: hypothetical protein LBU73_07890 [Helicobacteraceae bacterium]|jgi:ABC-type dipeptide/oligopeptide/nickel transport system ATPase component|nr:hypothetical protein [Helicobacteraceae bacterium]
MKRAEVLKLAEFFVKNSMDFAVVGEGGSGKTALLKEILTAAPIIHGSELRVEFARELKILFQSAKYAIVENIDREGAEFLARFFAARSILGVNFECAFAITAREKFSLPCAILPLENDETFDFHPLVAEALRQDFALLARAGSRRLIGLSRSLSSRPARALLEAMPAAFLGDDPSAEFITSLFLGENQIDSRFGGIARSETGGVAELLKKAAIATDEAARALESAAIESLAESGDKEDAEFFAAYISTLTQNSPRSALSLLFLLLDNPKLQTALALATRDQKVRDLIDSKLN